MYLLIYSLKCLVILYAYLYPLIYPKKPRLKSRVLWDEGTPQIRAAISQHRIALSKNFEDAPAILL